MVLFSWVAIKLLIGLASALVIMRVLGRKSLSQFTPIDFISLIVMGGIIEEMSHNAEFNPFHLIGALALWTLCIYLLDLSKKKSGKFRKLTQGFPVVIIQNGTIHKDVLEEERLTVEEVATMLREQGIFDYRLVDLAILEINGSISVYRKGES